MPKKVFDKTVFLHRQTDWYLEIDQEFSLALQLFVIRTLKATSYNPSLCALSMGTECSVAPTLPPKSYFTMQFTKRYEKTNETYKSLVNKCKERSYNIMEVILCLVYSYRPKHWSKFTKFSQINENGKISQVFPLFLLNRASFHCSRMG